MGYLISTKGRYALRVILDLAENGGDNPVPLKEIAERQDISLKYLETIMPNMIKAELVVGSHGKGGGYRLSRPVKDYTVGEVLRVAEGPIVPVACLGCDSTCDRAAFCTTLPIWKNLDNMINKYLDSLSLEDLLKGEVTVVKQ